MESTWTVQNSGTNQDLWDAKRVLIRADGPALAGFGVPGVLPDPVLTLYSGSNPIQTNTGWVTGTAADPAAAVAVGAFALHRGSQDSAILAVLPSGNYTAQVTSASGATGTVLVEVYELP